MSFNLPFGLNIASSDPTDTRQVVSNITERNALVDTGLSYEGMQVYVLSDTTTYTLKGNTNADWVVFGGSDEFIGLNDTPASYVGEAGQILQVNGTEDGIEFITAAEFDIHADEVSYDNTISGLAALDVQDAIDELAADESVGVNAVNGLFEEAGTNGSKNIGFSGPITEHSGLFLDGYTLQFIDDGFFTGKYVNFTIDSDAELILKETKNAIETMEDDQFIRTYRQEGISDDFSGITQNFGGFYHVSTDQTDFTDYAQTHTDFNWNLYDNFELGGDVVNLELNYDNGLEYGQSVAITQPYQLTTKEFVDEKTIDGGLIT